MEQSGSRECRSHGSSIPSMDRYAGSLDAQLRKKRILLAGVIVEDCVAERVQNPQKRRMRQNRRYESERLC